LLDDITLAAPREGSFDFLDDRRERQEMISYFQHARQMCPPLLWLRGYNIEDIAWPRREKKIIFE